MTLNNEWEFELMRFATVIVDIVQYGCVWADGMCKQGIFVGDRKHIP